MKKILSVMFFAALLPASVFAAQLAHGERYTLREGEQIAENLYVAGNVVSVEGTVTGDLIAAGGNVLVSGSVSKDVIAAGGDMRIDGTIGDDVRVAGGAVIINGAIAGDLVIAAGQVQVLSGATIGGDVIVAGGEVGIDGTINGKVRGAVDKLTVSGTIVGPVNVRTGSKFLVTKTAVLDGALSYASSREAQIENGAALRGGVTFMQVQQGREGFEAGDIKGWFVKLFMALATGLVIYFVNRAFVIQTVEQAYSRFWRMLLLGFAALVLIPAASILLMITVLGLPLGLLGILAFVALVIASWAFSGVVLGVFVYKKILKRQGNVAWYLVAGGIILLALISLVPFMGKLIAFVFFLPVLGALASALYKKSFIHAETI